MTCLVHSCSYNVTYLVATIGFTKIITAIVSIVRTRLFRNPIISLLKAFSVVDEMVALVLTQYAILSMQHSQSIDRSTGAFGISTSAIAIVVGIVLIVINLRRINALGSS